MGAVQLSKRDLTRAEALLTRALILTEARLGASHPTVTYTLNTLGVLYLDMRRYADAERQFQRAITILDQNGFAFDIRLARALKGLSDACLKGNNKDGAEAALQRAVPIARQSLTTHPDMAAILEAYSKLLGSMGKSNEAKQLYSEAQRARRTMALTVRAFKPD
jgi:tetratricopeptide (TPR) repeat protein